MKVTNQTISNQRLDYIDIAKSIGMLAIVWGHIRLGDWTTAFVYSWHIPLFFILSGMMFNKGKYVDIKSFLMRKVKTLLVPYVIYSFVTWVVWVVYAYISHADVESYWMPLFQTFIAQGCGGFLIHNVPLWFVTCLFVMELIYYFIADWKTLWILISSVLMALFSYLMTEYCNIFDFKLMPWNIEVALLGLPLFALGNVVVRKFSHHHLSNWVNEHRGASVVIIIIGAVLIVVGSLINGSINFGGANLRNPLITYPLALVGVIVILIISIWLANTDACQHNHKLMQWLKFYGRNSYTSMAIHNPIKGFMCVVLGVLFGCGADAVSLNSYYSFIAFILTIVVSIIGILLINFVKSRINCYITYHQSMKVS